MERILNVSFQFTGNFGISILILSFIVNTVLLPLYYLAEKWQNCERRLQRVLAPQLAEIKSQYQGEDRYNQTVLLYKKHDYHPIMSMRTSFGFIIQVPFFIAAYTMLSHYEQLNGFSFYFLNNLGAPDQILSIGNFGINVMPFIMTFFNLLSSFFYAKDFTSGEKTKLLFIALLFLVLLYSSPSGLVLYWTFSNVYSLVKNMIFNPGKELDNKVMV